MPGRFNSLLIRNSGVLPARQDHTNAGILSIIIQAAYHGNTEALTLLIQAGADVNHGTKTGFTALFSAVSGGHVEAVRILLNPGA